MVVKNSTLTVQVPDLADAVQRVNAVVAGVPGAYVAASTSTFRADPTPTAVGAAPGVAGAPKPAEQVVAPPRPQPAPAGQSASLTLKVPVDAFGDVLARLREIGTPLVENVSTQEVTEEYVDLDAQARNLEATEQQYLRLMERAQKIEEILPLQQRLTEVRGQIERLRGRMTLLQRRADSATIGLTLVLPPAKSGATPASEARPVRTLKDAFGHLAVFLQGTLDLVIYLGVFLLPLVPVGAGLLWWRTRRPAAPSAGGVV
jgi:hypothetical protein